MRLTAFALLTGLLAWPTIVAAADAPGVQITQRALATGKLADGAKELAAHVKKSPTDDNARFALGMIEFVQSIEHLSQSLYRYGLRTHRDIFSRLPIARLPVDENPKPEQISYGDVRRILQTLLDDLERSEQTLAGVKSASVKVPINFGQIRLDLDGDGKADENEELWRIYAKVMGGRGGGEVPRPPELVIAFDAGDVHWLRGYCHLLSAFAEIGLAYDGQEIFNCTAQLVFANPKTPYEFLKNKHAFATWGGNDLVDGIAWIHLLRMPVKEARRMSVAREHLKAVIRESRKSWELILAETDDDREWIPNPEQKQCVIPGMLVSQKMVDGWKEFLDEFERLLEGKVLVPFWRASDPAQGVNLKRVFSEPTPLDLVLWIQGTAAAPYLEKGTVTKPEFWWRLNNTFRGQFVGFGFWFN